MKPHRMLFGLGILGILAMAPAFAQSNPQSCESVINSNGTTYQQDVNATLDDAADTSTGMTHARVLQVQALFNTLCTVDLELGVHEALLFLHDDYRRMRRLTTAMREQDAKLRARENVPRASDCGPVAEDGKTYRQDINSTFDKAASMANAASFPTERAQAIQDEALFNTLCSLDVQFGTQEARTFMAEDIARRGRELDAAKVKAAEADAKLAAAKARAK